MSKLRQIQASKHSACHGVSQTGLPCPGQPAQAQGTEFSKAHQDCPTRCHSAAGRATQSLQVIPYWRLNSALQRDLGQGRSSGHYGSLGRQQISQGNLIWNQGKTQSRAALFWHSIWKLQISTIVPSVTERKMFLTLCSSCSAASRSLRPGGPRKSTSARHRKPTEVLTGASFRLGDQSSPIPHPTGSCKGCFGAPSTILRSPFPLGVQRGPRKISPLVNSPWVWFSVVTQGLTWLSITEN